jgi:inosine/xanthosine triphosphatase
MIINVGSKNPVKVDAVKEVVADYDLFRDTEVIGIEVASEVSDQPISLHETIQGAKARAKNAFHGCEYSFGIESGLITIPDTKTGYMDVTVCAIYDGKQFHLGLSSAFEYPINLTKRVIKDGLEISDAAKELQFTDNPQVGRAEGMIGILTHGRLNRKPYTQQAIITALIHLENPDLY